MSISNLRNNRVLMLLILILLIMIEGCSSINNLTIANNPQVTAESLFQHNIGTVTFEASAGTSNSTTQFYNFDNEVRDPSDFENNDIYFSVTGNTNLFLVFRPLSLAQGIFVVNNDLPGTITFNSKDCISDDYSKGSRPIPEINSKFCWITNDGSTVEFVVTDIIQIIDNQRTFQVTIKYVLWQK